MFYLALVRFQTQPACCTVVGLLLTTHGELDGSVFKGTERKKNTSEL